MTSRIWLAGALGAVVMFLWLFVAHMVLGLGEAGLRQIPNEAPLLAQLRSMNLDHGTYVFPNMDPKDQTANMKRLETSPSGMMVYYPGHHFNFGAALGIEFLTEFVLVLIAAYLLTLTRLTSFGSKVMFFAIVGLCVAGATTTQYWNWYGFSPTFTLAQVFTGLVGYILAGCVVAWLKVGSRPPA